MGQKTNPVQWLNFLSVANTILRFVLKIQGVICPFLILNLTLFDLYSALIRRSKVKSDMKISFVRPNFQSVVHQVTWMLSGVPGGVEAAL